MLILASEYVLSIPFLFSKNLKNCIMKKNIFLLALVTFSVTCKAQLVVYSSGNVGIGSGSYSDVLSKLSVNSIGTQGALASFYSDTVAYNTGIYCRHTLPTSVSGSYSKGIDVSNQVLPDMFNVGIEGSATASSSLGKGRAIGVLGLGGNSTSGYNYGVIGSLWGDQNGAGIFGTTSGVTGVDVGGTYAGYFEGDTYVSGTLTATSMYTPSDIRLKENVVSLSSEADSSLDKLSQLNVIKYNLIKINRENSDTAKTTRSAIKSTASSQKILRIFSTRTSKDLS